jgi:hypothetical protein
LKVSEVFSWSKDSTAGTSIVRGAPSAAVVWSNTKLVEIYVKKQMKRGSLKKISLRDVPNQDTSSMGDMAEELTAIQHTDVDRIVELARNINPSYEMSWLSNWETMLNELATEINEFNEDVIGTENIKLILGKSQIFINHLSEENVAEATLYAAILFQMYMLDPKYLPGDNKTTSYKGEEQQTILIESENWTRSTVEIEIDTQLASDIIYEIRKHVNTFPHIVSILKGASCSHQRRSKYNVDLKPEMALDHHMRWVSAKNAVAIVVTSDNFVPADGESRKVAGNMKGIMLETMEAEDDQSEQLLIVSDPSTMDVVWQMAGANNLFEVSELRQQRSYILTSQSASNTELTWETLQAHNFHDSNIKLKARETMIARKAAKLMHAIESDTWTEKANQEEEHLVTYKTKDGITEVVHNVVDEIQGILDEQVNIQGKEEFILASCEMNKYNEIVLPPLLQVQANKRPRTDVDNEAMNTEMSDSEGDRFKLTDEEREERKNLWREVLRKTLVLTIATTLTQSVAVAGEEETKKTLKSNPHQRPSREFENMWNELMKTYFLAKQHKKSEVQREIRTAVYNGTGGFNMVITRDRNKIIHWLEEDNKQK